GYYVPGEHARSADGWMRSTLRFDFPKPVHVAAVRIYGDNSPFGRINVKEIAVEIDGQTLIQETNAAEKIMATPGHQLRLAFSPRATTSLKLRLAAPKPFHIGEISVEGFPRLPEMFQGRLRLELEDCLSGQRMSIGEREIKLDPFQQSKIVFAVQLPPARRGNAYNLVGELTGEHGVRAESRCPVLALCPVRPLKEFVERGPKVFRVGPIGTSGFRELVPFGAGFGHPLGWDCEDANVWAFAHGMVAHADGDNSATTLFCAPARPSWIHPAPWQEWPNGVEFLPDTTRRLIRHRLRANPNFQNADRVHYNFSDYWEPSPFFSSKDMFTWNRLEEFQRFLQAQKKGALSGKTKAAVIREIKQKYSHEWERFRLVRYLMDLEGMAAAFRDAGKTFDLSGQLWTCFPPSVAGRAFKIINGVNDDSTWGMVEDSIPKTTGRIFSTMALAPALRMQALLMWGFDSRAYIIMYYHWQHPVLTESARRHTWHRAFRGVVRPDGSYTNLHAYGFGRPANIGPALGPHDFIEFHRAIERFQFLDPTGPIGAGLVLSSSVWEKPEHYKPHSIKDSPLIVRMIETFNNLHLAGLSIPFCMNATQLDVWRGNAPLILVNAEDFTVDDLKAIERKIKQGVRVAAFCRGRPGKLLADLFGITSAGEPRTGQVAGRISGKPIVTTTQTVFVPVSARQMSPAQARSVSEILKQVLAVPITFPRGTAGYGFVSSGRHFIVIEDWQDTGRHVELQYRPQEKIEHLRAVNINDHTPLP
ncbi:MAG: hypothetical protein D6820_05040, partial [Lentisphaerae bacterium]